jgi:hypothetical protein
LLSGIDELHVQIEVVSALVLPGEGDLSPVG